MRDYVFTPVVKVIVSSQFRAWHWVMITVAYFITMVLIALWHGTTLGFLLFGLLQGGVLVLIQLLQRNNQKNKKRITPSTSLASAAGGQALAYWQRPAMMIATYVFVSLSLVLWMASNGRWLSFYAGMSGLR